MDYHKKVVGILWHLNVFARHLNRVCWCLLKTVFDFLYFDLISQFCLAHFCKAGFVQSLIVSLLQEDSKTKEGAGARIRRTEIGLLTYVY